MVKTPCHRSSDGDDADDDKGMPARPRNPADQVHHRRRYSMPPLRRPRRGPKPDRRRRPQGIPLFEIRLADASDSEAIFSILDEVACHVPVDLSTPEHVKALKSQINDCCHDGLSFVAVDEDGAVVGFQLAKRIRYYEDDTYIHLTYGGLTGAASATSRRARRRWRRFAKSWRRE